MPFMLILMLVLLALPGFAQIAAPAPPRPGFDWGAFLSVALPVIFTTTTSVVGFFMGQRSNKPDGSAAAHTASALQIAAQAVSAAAQIAAAVQIAQIPQSAGPDGSARPGFDTNPV